MLSSNERCASAYKVPLIGLKCAMQTHRGKYLFNPYVKKKLKFLALHAFLPVKSLFDWSVRVCVLI